MLILAGLCRNGVDERVLRVALWLGRLIRLKKSMTTNTEAIAKDALTGDDTLSRARIQTGCERRDIGRLGCSIIVH